jgi:hypothetical protein
LKENAVVNPLVQENVPSLKESFGDEIESYKPQKSITPSHHSVAKSRSFALEPSKPIRSNQEIGPIAKQNKKKTIFDDDTTYNQFDFTKPQPQTQGNFGSIKNRTKGYNPLNTIIKKNQDPYMKSYITDSALPPSGRTPVDPYKNVYNYSRVKQKDSRIVNSQAHEHNRNLPPKKIPFKNFVENFASRNSVGKNNIRSPELNKMQNSKKIGSK